VFDVEAVMRRSLALVIPILALTAVSPGYAVSTRRKDACPPARSHPVASDAQAQVYVAARPTRVLGCVYGSKHSYWLGGPPVSDADFSSERADFTIGGTFVAFEASTFRDFPGPNLPQSEQRVVVESLRTGRVLHRVPAGSSTHDRVGFGSITTLLVKSDGAAAWIVGNGLGDVHSTAYEVAAVDGTGSRVLAESSEIEPKSLALAGSRLYWTQGSKVMSATLN
jgi:hypothetical protein